MMYSVWNQSAKKYDYFEAGAPEAVVNTPSPKHLRPGKLATSPKAASWPLPADARKVGQGEHPRGRIASRSSGVLGAVDFSSSGTKAILLIVAGLVAWKYLR